MKKQHSTKNKWITALSLSFAMTCAMAVGTLSAPVSVAADVEFAISEASVAFGDDLALNYFVSVPEGYEIVGEYTYKGETFDAEAPTDDKGFKKFRFDGITPQSMNDKVTLKISVTNQDVAPIEYTYSVREYCELVLSKTAEELGFDEEKMDAMKTLAADVLNFGAAAQKLTHYNEENYANAGLDQEQASTFDEEEARSINAYAKLPSNNGSLTGDLIWSGVRLYFNSYVNLEIAILAAPNQSAEGIKIKYQNESSTGLLPIRVLTEQMPAKPEGKEDWQWFVARLEKLTSIDFNTVYTFSICNSDGVEWDDAEHLTYSVSTYVARHHQETTNELERALFLYGKSAFRYKFLDHIQETISNEATVQAPTFTEEGAINEIKHGGYIFVKEGTLPTLNTANAYTLGEVTYATLENNGAEPTLKNGSVQYTLKENAFVKFNVAVDHVIKMNGENYTVHNLPDNASYNSATDTVTFALNGVNYDKGILAWNKSITLTLTGENTISGEAFVNKDRTHTVDGDNNAVEDLPYTIYVRKMDGLTKFTGDGTLTVNGMGVRMYGHAEVNGATLNVNVDKRVDGTYKGETNDIYSEGFKADGAMEFTNANFTATASTDNVTKNMDKSGMVFAGLMLNNSNVTINNFAIGAYMNGEVTVGENSSLSANNAYRFGFAWDGDKKITVGNNATFNVSINQNATALVSDISKIVMQDNSNVTLYQPKDGNALSTLDKLHIPNTATARITLLDNDQNPVTLKAEKGVASVTKGDVTNGRVMEFPANDVHNLTLYLTYSNTNYSGDIGGWAQWSFGFYAYQNAEYTSFDYFFLQWFGGDNTQFSTRDAYGSASGATDGLSGDRNSVVVEYNGVTFTRPNPAGGQGLHALTWQTLFLGVDMSWMG